MTQRRKLKIPISTKDFLLVKFRNGGMQIMKQLETMQLFDKKRIDQISIIYIKIKIMIILLLGLVGAIKLSEKEQTSNAQVSNCGNIFKYYALSASVQAGVLAGQYRMSISGNVKEQVDLKYIQAQSYCSGTQESASQRLLPKDFSVNSNGGQFSVSFGFQNKCESWYVQKLVITFQDKDLNQIGCASVSWKQLQ